MSALLNRCSWILPFASAGELHGMGCREAKWKQKGRKRGLSRSSCDFWHSKLTCNCWCGTMLEGGCSPSCEAMPPALAGQPRRGSGVGAWSLRVLSRMITTEHLPLLITQEDQRVSTRKSLQPHPVKTPPAFPFPLHANSSL